MSHKRVKAYGLINFTKPQYIVSQIIAFTLIALIFFASYFYGYSSSESMIIRNMWVICIVVFILELFETLCVLKKFNDLPTD